MSYSFRPVVTPCQMTEERTAASRRLLGDGAISRPHRISSASSGRIRKAKAPPGERGFHNYTAAGGTWGVGGALHKHASRLGVPARGFFRTHSAAVAHSVVRLVARLVRRLVRRLRILRPQLSPVVCLP